MAKIWMQGKERFMCPVYVEWDDAGKEHRRGLDPAGK